MKKPRLKSDWVGRYVRLDRELRTQGGTSFKAGSVMKVAQNHGGLSLTTPERCPVCEVGIRHYISKVSEHEVELLPEDFVPEEFPTGAALIVAERKRQIKGEGWTAEHDDRWTREQLAEAAVFYAAPEKYGEMLAFWPWAVGWNKKAKHDRIRQLAIAGALIAAEIDRLQRATAVPEEAS